MNGVIIEAYSVKQYILILLEPITRLSAAHAILLASPPESSVSIMLQGKGECAVGQ